MNFRLCLRSNMEINFNSVCVGIPCKDDYDFQCFDYYNQVWTMSISSLWGELFIWLVCGISAGLARNMVIIIIVDVQDFRFVLFTLLYTTRWVY